MGWGTYPKRVREEGFLNATLKQATPEMSGAEQALMAEQIYALRGQQTATAHQMHYKINEDGSWTKMSDDEWLATASETERQEFQSYQKGLEKYRMALEGEVPLTSGMQTAKDEEWRGMKATTGMTGANANDAKITDTISAQRLNLYKQKWNNLQQDYQNQVLGISGQNLGMNRERLGMGLNPAQISNPQGYMAALEPFQQYNAMKYNARAANQANTQGYAGMGVGLLASMYGGRAGSMYASRRYGNQQGEPTGYSGGYE